MRPKFVLVFVLVLGSSSSFEYRLGLGKNSIDRFLISSSIVKYAHISWILQITGSGAHEHQSITDPVIFNYWFDILINLKILVEDPTVWKIMKIKSESDLVCMVKPSAAGFTKIKLTLNFASQGLLISINTCDHRLYPTWNALSLGRLHKNLQVVPTSRGKLCSSRGPLQDYTDFQPRFHGCCNIILGIEVFIY